VIDWAQCLKEILCWQKTVRDWGRWKKVASYLTDLLHSTFYSITCTLPWHAYLPTMIWQHKLYRKSTKACRPTKSCILRLGERPKAPRAVEKDLQAGVGFERCYEKKKVSCPFGVSFNLDSCRETRSSNLIKLCCCQTPHCIWGIRQLIDIFGAGCPCQPFSPIGKRKGKKDPRAKVFERVPLFSIFNIPKWS
jgi:hypothetical protein